MPATDWGKLKADAAETLQNIDTEKLTKSAYTLLGASVAILDHPIPVADRPAEIPLALSQTTPVPPQMIDYVPHSLIDEHIQEMLLHFTSYMQNKSLEQLHHSEHHGAIACDSLRKMLAVNEEIAADLYRTADTEEREMIKKSYRKINAL